MRRVQYERVQFGQLRQFGWYSSVTVGIVRLRGTSTNTNTNTNQHDDNKFGMTGWFGWDVQYSGADTVRDKYDGTVQMGPG